jgi:hypothetical protein
MMRILHFRLVLAATALIAPQANAAQLVTERSVAAHGAFLASDALAGRGSATRDEAIAAAYAASQFRSYGLVPAPGMDGFAQSAVIVRQTLAAAPTLSIAGERAAGATLLLSPGRPVSGPLSVALGADPAALPAADVVLAASRTADALAVIRAANSKQIKLLILRESEATRRLLAGMGGTAHLPTYVEGVRVPDGTSVVTVPDAAMDALVMRAAAPTTLLVPTVQDRSTTTNAIGFLKGSDPDAGVLLLTAHLDHLGRRPDGTIMHGANDDASGVTAVLELAQVLAAGPQPQRSVLFVCFGSEEIGGYGSTYFAEHPPVHLRKIAANLEFEMIGAQDPELPANSLMMTGFERSSLGPALKAHGALLAPDPYPDEHFFERSDNYALALKGIVAHTVSGWAVTPSYHEPTDTIANLNIPFMTAAIRSLVKPIQWLANSSFTPAWEPGGMPVRRR